MAEAPTEGVPLSELIGQEVGLAVACKIVLDLAEAAEYAHERGKTIGIAPAHIAVYLDGSVKIERASQTAIAYRAPEQIQKKDVDPRAEVFGLGVVLHELIAGAHLFAKENDFETMEAIVRAKAPAIEPPELDAIVQRCLSKDREDRYASPGQLADAITAFLAARGVTASARRVRARVQDIVSDRAPPERNEDAELSNDDLLIVPTNAQTAADCVPNFPPEHPSNRPPWTATEPRGSKAPEAARAKAPSGGYGTVLIVGAIVLVAIGYLAFATPWRADPAPAERARPPLTGTLSIDSAPSGARVTIDGREAGTTPITVPRLSTGTHRLRFELEGHAPHEGPVEVRADRTTAITQPLRPIAAGPIERGRLTITSEPRAVVYYDGERLGETPLDRVELPAGVVRLELETPDGMRHVRGAMVRANDSSSVHIELN